jgi:protein involved in polysaccharide export with SLBB domain
MEALDDKDLLRPGDVISFRVIEDRDPAVSRMVTDTGEIDFPLVGRLKVEGTTCSQVARELKKRLEVDYYKNATVIVGLDVMVNREVKEQAAAVTHDVVWLIGQVRQVGPQEILKSQPMTVSQIILKAGGFGDFADQRKVRLIHRSSPPPGGAAVAPQVTDGPVNGQIVDVKAVYNGEPNAVDPYVQPNDYIIVSKRLVNF